MSEGIGFIIGFTAGVPRFPYVINIDRDSYEG